MRDLPFLTEPARKVLRCCVKDLCDVRKSGDKIQPHMIYTYLAENAIKPLSKHEIDDCLSYLEDVGLIYDVDRDIIGKINRFHLNHMGHIISIWKKCLKIVTVEKFCVNHFSCPPLFQSSLHC